MRFWRKLPFVVRAVIVGLFLSTIGHAPPGAFYFANLKLWPQVPWSLAFVALYLWLLWEYLDGRWWPASTSDSRRRDLRGGPLPPRVWRWALIAGGLAMSSVGALHFVLARIESIQYEGFYRLFEMNIPPLTLAAVIIGASAVAGLVEEAAFRGYMQTPIERRHGLLVAILVPSTLFVFAHFTDVNVTMSFSRVFFILAAAVNYAMLTHLTGSIRPGIVLHATGDAFGIGLLWLLWRLTGPLSSRPMGWAAASRDPIFWLYCVEAALLGAASIWAYFRLAGLRNNRRHALSSPIVVVADRHARSAPIAAEQHHQ